MTLLASLRAWWSRPARAFRCEGCGRTWLRRLVQDRPKYHVFGVFGRVCGRIVPYTGNWPPISRPLPPPPAPPAPPRAA